MGHGGARPGSGRKKGSLTTKTQELLAKAALDGITPLEVMLKAMRLHAEDSKWDEAAGIAKDAAPYIHPRLAAIEHAGKGPGGTILTEVVYRWADVGKTET